MPRSRQFWTLALVKVGVEGCSGKPKLTFAIARRTAVDLSQVFKTPPRAFTKSPACPGPASHSDPSAAAWLRDGRMRIAG
jgi:hypothetical protein